MTAKERYDAIVIGAGQAGVPLSTTLADLLQTRLGEAGAGLQMTGCRKNLFYSRRQAARR